MCTPSTVSAITPVGANVEFKSRYKQRPDCLHISPRERSTSTTEALSRAYDVASLDCTMTVTPLALRRSMMAGL